MKTPTLPDERWQPLAAAPDCSDRRDRVIQSLMDELIRLGRENMDLRFVIAEQTALIVLKQP